MKFKDWIAWIFVKPFTKKPYYYKRKDGVVTLTIRNCDVLLKDIANFWGTKRLWNKVSKNYPDLSFAGLRSYDTYWDGTHVFRTPDDYESPKIVEVYTDNLYVYLISDKTNAKRKLDVYAIEYTYKGKDLIITIKYEYTNDRDDEYYL